MSSRGLPSVGNDDARILRMSTKGSSSSAATLRFSRATRRRVFLAARTVCLNWLLSAASAWG
eukprot:9724546-Prorocentrum_lima.AAC.1